VDGEGPEFGDVGGPALIPGNAIEAGNCAVAFLDKEIFGGEEPCEDGAEGIQVHRIMRQPRDDAAVHVDRMHRLDILGAGRTDHSSSSRR
jgi:hypothetical protein